jgi:hypothetical protein
MRLPCGIGGPIAKAVEKVKGAERIAAFLLTIKLLTEWNI